MTLAQKTALIVSLFAIANVGIAYSIHRNVVAPEFADLEKQEVEKNLKRALLAIKREGFVLDVLAQDTASWDATYDFVESRDPDFYAMNLSPGALKTTVLDWAIVVDSSGKVLSEPVLDIQTGEPLGIPEIPHEKWSESHPLLLGETQVEPIVGLMATSEGPMLVAARDILTSIDEGPSRGRVIMGRRFDANFIAGLAKRASINLEVLLLSDAAISQSMREALIGYETTPYHETPSDDDDHLYVYTLLKDIAGVPSFVLRVSLPREITQRAADVNRLSLLWYLIQGAVLAFLIMAPLHKAIIAPLGVLTEQLRSIRRTNDLSVQVSMARNDEIGELSREFGSMLKQLGRHIDDRRKSEDALRHSEERLQEAQQVAQVGSWEIDLASGVWWWSDELYRIYGRQIDAGPPTSEQIRSSIHRDDKDRVEGALRALIEGSSESKGAEARVVVETGDVQHHHILWNVERDAEGRPLRVYGTVSDVTERYRSEEAMRRAAAVFETANEAIVIADPFGNIVDVNSAFSTITGHQQDEVIGEKAEILNSGLHDFNFYQGIAAEVEQSGKWEGEIWIRHKDGMTIPTWASIGRTLGRESSTEQIVAVFNDMTERKNAEEVIARQATYDLLTGIPNRALFIDRLAQETLRAGRSGQGVALIFIDLDGFKKVNDTLGHSAGDDVLRLTAQRIKQSIRDVDTAARVGGDEFAVIVPKLRDPVDAEQVAKRVLAEMAIPMSVQGQDMLITASIGISIFPSDSEDETGLLRDADIAMYRSKNSGGNSIEFFTAEMNERAMRRMQVELQLQRAIEVEEFELHYQPIVSLPDGRMVGVEVLLRWHNSELGLVDPGEFIPVAESTGIIVSIGAWVLETACRQVKEWQEAGWSDLRVAVNLSPREVDRGDAIDSISNALAKSGLAPQFLEVEVTERVLLDDVETAGSAFRAIKDLGVRLCVDDFGTGYSSLSYLRNYPFDVLKIDRAFVCDASRHANGVSLLRAIISMAESLDLQVIAEGVETVEQFDLLCELGCGFAQGYYFCAPLSAARIGIGGPIVDLDAEASTVGEGQQGWLRALKVRDD
ncbi:MAG: EAL domain-containing protein [Deltaproteobacteria bacterium]|nr:EAL domain-containing protein [Deltaproteobacteria bacterium]